MPRPHFKLVKLDALRVVIRHPNFFRAPQVIVMCSQVWEVMTQSSWSHWQPFSVLWVHSPTRELCDLHLWKLRLFQFNLVQLQTIQSNKYVFIGLLTLHFWLCLPGEWWEPCFSNNMEILHFISFLKPFFKKTVKHRLHIFKNYALGLDFFPWDSVVWTGSVSMCVKHPSF